MSDILKKIETSKRAEIAAAKLSMPPEDIARLAARAPQPPPL